MSKKQFEVDRETRKARRQTRAARPRQRQYMTRKVDSDETLTLTREYQPTPEEVEQRGIVTQMARAYIGMIDFYKLPYGGDKPHNLAVEEAAAFHADSLEWLRSHPDGVHPERISWHHIAEAGRENLAQGLTLWARVSEAADDELASGIRAAEVAGQRSEPYALAQFLSIRSAFADEWQPRGGIESALIDMLTVTFSLYMYWTGIAHQRSTETHDTQHKAVRNYESRGWKSPYQSEADALEQAYRQADGYNRQFLRTLRQLRDLRRYAPPVIINQPGGQVNVGQQQVNVNVQEQDNN